MRQHFMNFMRNRYGTDGLNYALLVFYFMLWFINLFLRNQIFSFLILILMVLILFRTFSTNIPARRRELALFQKHYSRLRQWFRIIKRNWGREDQYYYAICRNCRQTLRLPKGKGSIEVTCPKCGYHFDKRT